MEKLPISTANATPLTMQWRGVVTLQNEVYLKDQRSHWHRCFQIETANPLALRHHSVFTLNIDDDKPLDDGTIVTMAGELIAPNDGTESMIVMYGEVEVLTPTAAILSGHRLNNLAVHSRGIVLQRTGDENNWSSLIVNHNVFVNSSVRWIWYTAMYVDIGDKVLPMLTDLRSGSIVDLSGTVLEYNDESNMWIIQVRITWPNMNVSDKSFMLPEPLRA
ncbi:uncharacterized protein MELLADRAFT_63056 [Melampsora larici-populina 98AG31]|uniref:Uncharacterized protein n=1 Tax=Melampsora larici-populina (strain 98AG31 / pathotype 3-4-7) TaxID=747676 RepID=F4RL51_MELLP|nr:uncharacterized protein MELLADRAFT_63056 [Melampsora larici-populina 98AG31]EGG06928.1 hypothetical protein MELLADRAFT_63056 [Melampsora larici-populina 98AG31]